MNCKWVSRKDKNLKCNRHADSSGYCLFHKQNKSKREIALFDKTATVPIQYCARIKEFLVTAAISEREGAFVLNIIFSSSHIKIY